MFNSLIRAVASVRGSSSGNSSNTSKKGAFQEIHEHYPIELILGDEDKGIDLIDASYVITNPKDYQRRICDPLSVEGLTFASLASRRDSELFATMWSDYRTDRSLGYDLKTAKPTTLPTLRVLDAAVGRIVKDVNHMTRGVILSCSDGYDHPIEPREQQEIGKTACAVSREMVKVISRDLFHLNTEHEDDDIIAGLESHNEGSNAHPTNARRQSQTHHSNSSSDTALPTAAAAANAAAHRATSPTMDEDFLYNSPEGLAARDRDRDKRMRPKLFYDITENIPLSATARDVGEIAKEVGDLVHDQVAERGVMDYVGVGNVTVSAQLRIPFQTVLAMQQQAQQQSATSSSGNATGSSGNRGSISLPNNGQYPQLGSSFAAPPGVGLASATSAALMHHANAGANNSSAAGPTSPLPQRVGANAATAPNIASPSSSSSSAVVEDPTLSSSGYYYEVKTISVGDCLGFAFIPDPLHPSIIQLSHPVDFAEHGFLGAEEYQPASITRWKGYQVDVQCHDLPAGAIVFTVTDGVWDKFRKTSPYTKEEIQKQQETSEQDSCSQDEANKVGNAVGNHREGTDLGNGRTEHYVTYEGKEYKYIRAEIDLDAIRDCLISCVSSATAVNSALALAAANASSNVSGTISRTTSQAGKKGGKDRERGGGERESFGSRGSSNNSRSFRLRDKDRKESVSASASAVGKDDLDAVYAAYYASIDPNQPPVMAEPSVKDFVNCLRNETIRRADKLRAEYDSVMTILRDYATSIQTDSVLRERFLTRDLTSTKVKSKPWQDCKHDTELPEKVKKAADRLCELEHFKVDVVPFLALLEFRPSLGDDCTIMAAKLPIVEKELLRSLVEVSTVTNYKRKKLQVNVSKQFELVKKSSSLLLASSSYASSLDSPLPLYEIIDELTGETYEEIVPTAYKQCPTFLIHKTICPVTGAGSSATSASVTASNNGVTNGVVTVKKKYDPAAINAVTDLIDELYAMHIQEERERTRQNSKSWFS